MQVAIVQSHRTELFNMDCGCFMYHFDDDGDDDDDYCYDVVKCLPMGRTQPMGRT